MIWDEERRQKGERRASCGIHDLLKIGVEDFVWNKCFFGCMKTLVSAEGNARECEMLWPRNFLYLFEKGKSEEHAPTCPGIFGIGN